MYLQRLINQKILKSEFFKNTSILISGTVIAQLIPILIQPLLRRIYTPEVFGAYAVYTSLLGILVISSSLKYELAIVLPKKDKDAANIFFLTIIISLIINFILILSIVLFRHKILKIINLPDNFAIYLYLLPVGVFFFSFFQSINYWLIRKKKFISISQNKIIRRASEAGSQVAMFKSFPGYGLIYSDLIGHFANSCSSAFHAYKSNLSLRLFSVSKLKYVIRKYAEFPKYNAMSSLMGAISTLLPAVLINKYYSSEYVGFYDLTNMALSVPFALIATSVSNVMIQRISNKSSNNISIYKEIIRLFIGITTIAIFEVLIIQLFGVKLFSFVFGKNWEMSGQISKILVWSYALNFIVSCFSFLFVALKKIKIYSLWQFIYFLVILGLLMLNDVPFVDFIQKYVYIVVGIFAINLIFVFIVLTKYELAIKSENCKK